MRAAETLWLPGAPTLPMPIRMGIQKESFSRQRKLERVPNVKHCSAPKPKPCMDWAWDEYGPYFVGPSILLHCFLLPQTPDSSGLILMVKWLILFCRLVSFFGQLTSYWKLKCACPFPHRSSSGFFSVPAEVYGNWCIRKLCSWSNCVILTSLRLYSCSRNPLFTHNEHLHCILW